MMLSIVIPVFNVEKYIGTLLKSIEKNISFNKENNIELIFVIDGSQQNEISIINKYNFENCTIIEQSNSGVSAARNAGLLIAKGKYIWFVDSDDYISDNAFQKILLILREDSDVVHINYIHEDEKGNELGVNLLQKGKIPYELIGNISSLVWSFIWKKSFLQINDLKFHEGVMHEDIEFITLALGKAISISYLDEKLYYYVKHPVSITMGASYNPKRLIDTFSVIEEINKEYKKLNDYNLKSHFSLIISRTVMSTVNSARTEMDSETIRKCRNLIITHREYYRHFLNSKQLKYTLLGLVYWFSPSFFFKINTCLRK